MSKILAIELPAPCPMACGFCRSPKHGEGDTKKLFRIATEHMMSGEYEEVYLTSNGETGLSSMFVEMLALAQKHGLRAAALGATKATVVAGLTRVEISRNQYTQEVADVAIKKAHQLRIPVVISFVDTGSGEINAEKMMQECGASGIVIRALQSEGMSSVSVGKTKVVKRDGIYLGAFPARAYRELATLIGNAVICVNSFGRIVPFIGSVV